jgi:RNA polymerase sigma-32 factor
MKAVKRFDPEKGYRLISYAVWWIKAQIHKFILETYSLVKMGTTQAQRKLFSSLGKIKRKLASIDGTQPTDEELASALNVETKDVTDMKQRMSSRDNSLDAPIGDETSTTRLDALSNGLPSQEDIVSRKEAQTKIRALIAPFASSLKDKERDIFTKRLLTDDPATLQEIGDKYRISRERVRQIEDNLKKKIKGYLTEKGFDYSA